MIDQNRLTGVRIHSIMLFNSYYSYLINKNEYFYKIEECLYKKEKEKRNNPQKQEKKSNHPFLCRIFSYPVYRFHRVHFSFLFLRFMSLHEAFLSELGKFLSQPY